jgi:cellulose synthase/poly-beta-1,6-N-acetylglucosamine synthase-like glycosyltransferase
MSIWAGLKHFKKEGVVAVAGFVEVENQDNLLTKFQQYEYLIGLNMIRRGLANFGVVPVIPGPVGLFNAKVLRDVGGFKEDKNLMAEDAELSLRIVAAGWKVESEENMIAYTEAPEDWKSLSRQRYRWNRGMMQAFALNCSSLLKSNNRGRFLAAHLLFEIYGVLLINVAMVLSFMVHTVIHGDSQLLDKWFLGLIASEVISTALVVFRHKQKFKWVLTGLATLFTYNSILMFWRTFSFVDEVLGVGMTWDKLERKGTK